MPFVEGPGKKLPKKLLKEESGVIQMREAERESPPAVGTLYRDTQPHGGEGGEWGA